MTTFIFPAWYARMGYAGYRGGVRDCARDLGVTREHVRLLRRGERQPSGPMVKLCEAIERHKDQAAWLRSAEIVVTDEAGKPKGLMVDGKITEFPVPKDLRLPENVPLVMTATEVDQRRDEMLRIATDVLTKPR